MVNILRTNHTHTDFQDLVRLLDADLAIRDGDENAFYAQFNGIETLHHCVVYYENDIPLGCGAFKKFDDTTVEIKRMFVMPEARGKGIASVLLADLEQWATTSNYHFCILETGLRQPEAIALYKKNGYHIIPNYPPYEKMDNSVCFRKRV